MTKYLSDCHGAETTLYTSLTDASVSIRRCNKCGQPCTIHEVKEEPKEGHTLAGHMKSILKMATIKEEPVKEETYIKSSQIDAFLRKKKVDEKTKIGISLLVELMHGFAIEIITPPISEGEVSERDFLNVLWDKHFISGETKKMIEHETYQLHLRGTAKLREEIAKLKEQLILNDIWQSDKDSEYKALYEIEYVDTLKSQIEAKEKFKEYVHMRLDKMNIPTHPDGEHSKAGCRIGDRLDIIESQLNELKK